MDKKIIIEAVKKARESSPKRNFKQSFDFIVNLKGLDLKKPEEQIEFFMTLPQKRDKKFKVCALIGAELADEAKAVCDFSISQEDFPKYSENKKLMKKLSEDYDFFIAQANIMPKIAAAFGRVLGPRGKMPNPKAGCIVPPKSNLKPLYEKLQNTVRINAKTQLMVQTFVGKEEMSDDAIADNIYTIYDQVVHHLPQDKNNIASMFIKLTMGQPSKLTEKISEEQRIEKRKLLHKKVTDKQAPKGVNA